jgi:hypothetical protein
MKKRTVITTEKREVWVIRRAEDNPPAPQDAPHDAAAQSEASAPAVSENSESQSKEERDEDK